MIATYGNKCCLGPVSSASETLKNDSENIEFTPTSGGALVIGIKFDKSVKGLLVAVPEDIINEMYPSQYITNADKEEVAIRGFAAIEDETVQGQWDSIKDTLIKELIKREKSINEARWKKRMADIDAAKKRLVEKKEKYAAALEKIAATTSRAPEEGDEVEDFTKEEERIAKMAEFMEWNFTMNFDAYILKSDQFGQKGVSPYFPKRANFDLEAFKEQQPGADSLVHVESINYLFPDGKNDIKGPVFIVRLSLFPCKRVDKDAWIAWGKKDLAKNPDEYKYRKNNTGDKATLTGAIKRVIEPADLEAAAASKKKAKK